MSDQDRKPASTDTGLAEPKRRIGFMEGRLNVPADFDEMGQEEIVRLFEGDTRNGDREGSDRD